MNKTLKSNILLVVVGLIALAAGILFTVSGKKQAARDTEPATAVVVEYAEEEEFDSTMDTYRTVYYPVLSYEVNGVRIRSRYSQSDSDMKYEPGTKLEIKYNPDDPEEFIISGDGRIENGAVWVIPAGAVIFLLGTVRILLPIIKSKKQTVECSVVVKQ